MPTLKPFRDIDPHDVINLFKFESGTANKGTFVKIVSGFDNEDPNGQVAYANDITAASYGNTVSMRYTVKPYVTATTSGDVPIGMLLYDVRETDENGERLWYHPRKQAEMQCVISGQAVPILTKGMVLYSGITGVGPAAVTAGQSLYTSMFGELSTTGSATNRVGFTLGPKDSKGWTLIRFACN
jgi:hypothetical protein